jgi:hypothetical protein
MIKVTLDGVEYTKASHVAKQFGYTADYLGQLCRAKKVNARLVGRSWFINVPSLEAHREKKYSNLQKGQPMSETSGTLELSQKGDTTSKKYLRRVPPPDAPKRRYVESVDSDGAVRHLSLRYEQDDHTLIPRVSEKPKVTLLKVDIAESEPLHVKTVENAVSRLAPEPLPDVALSGSLKVSEIKDEEMIRAEKGLEPVDVHSSKKHSSKRDNNKNKLKITEVETLASEKVARQKAKSKTRADEDVTTEESPERVEMSNIAFSPASVSAQTDTHALPVKNLNNQVEEVTISYQIPAVGMALAVLVGALILSAEQVGFVTAEVVDFALNFSWSNVANMALVLFTG